MPHRTQVFVVSLVAYKTVIYLTLKKLEDPESSIHPDVIAGSLSANSVSSAGQQTGPTLLSGGNSMRWETLNMAIPLLKLDGS